MVHYRDEAKGLDEYIAEKGGDEAVHAHALRAATKLGISLEEATRIVARYSEDEITAIAMKGWNDAASMTGEEVRVVAAWAVVRAGGRTN
jgi:hypothetical protein